MTTGTTKGNPPRGILRLFLRLPVWLFRLHLGWLLLGRFVMFRHVGRNSGLPRYTVVEVVRHDRATGAYIIASGWGEKADWFRNIQKTPQVLLYTGWRQFEAIATRLSLEDAVQELCDYAQRHPVAFRYLAGLMIGRRLSGTMADCRTLAQSVPLVALVPIGGDR